jgi:hypothetical protein
MTRFGYSAVADTILVRASARVRSYTGQTITSASSTVDFRYPFLLPERPIIAITSVNVVADDGTLTALTANSDYKTEGQHIITLSSEDGVPYKASLLRVAYTHGFTTIPDDLAEVVCSIASRMASAPAGLRNGIQSESADGESITWGGDAYGGVTELTTAEKRVLDRIFPHTRAVPKTITTM